MAQIVGYRHVSGTSKRTGKQFDAYVVSWIEKETESGAFGYRAGDEFVNRELFEKATEGMAAVSLLRSLP